MSATTGIEWTDATWNPIRGCSRVSEGCRHCYAERVAARFAGPGQPYAGLATMHHGEPRWTGEVALVEKHLGDPLRWRRPRRIFVNSMSDLFHERLPNEDIAAVFGVMVKAFWHTFQVLTKRPQRMREWFDWAAGGRHVWRQAQRFEWPTHALRAVAAGAGDWGWPRLNIWLGVSVEDQATADERIPLLLQTPATVRFISAEPLLGPIDLSSYLGTGLSWVIVGGESGPGARPMDLDWARSLRDQCQAAGVPYFLKQLGGWPDKRGGVHAVLDGHTWTEMPA